MRFHEFYILSFFSCQNKIEISMFKSGGNTKFYCREFIVYLLLWTFFSKLKENSQVKYFKISFKQCCIVKFSTSQEPTLPFECKHFFFRIHQVLTFKAVPFYILRIGIQFCKQIRKLNLNQEQGLNFKKKKMCQEVVECRLSNVLAEHTYL